MPLALSDLPLLFGAAFSESLNLLHLDRASAHIATTNTSPDNVVPIFQLPTQLECIQAGSAVHSAPSHSPELNPIERVWQDLKKLFKDHNFPSLPALRQRVFKVVNSLSKTALRSLTGWSYLLSATQHI